MEIRQIQYFLMLANIGNFTDAAEELYISQSSLSKQIIALEKELGISLLDRTRRKIRLTRAGETFRRHAELVNADYLAMLAELNAYKMSPSFSILAIPVIAQYGIPSYLAQFKKVYPHFDFILEEREASLILPAIADYKYDLAFVRDIYFDRELFSSLAIAKDRMLVVVSKSHRLANCQSVALNALQDENFIMFEKGTLIHELAVDACHQAGFKPRIFYSSLRIESILSLVSSNHGISLMMEKVFAYAKHQNVVGIPLDQPIESHVLLAWQKNRKLSKPARKFVEFIGKRLAVSLTG